VEAVGTSATCREVERPCATWHAARACEGISAAAASALERIASGTRALFRWWCAAAQYEFEAVLIVCLALLGVRENFIGL
jgi:hypothetical protein